MNAQALLAVAGGGALGAVLRHLLAQVMARPPGAFPAGHFTANVVGSVLIGVLFVVLASRADAQFLRLFLITGVLGAFTTYSAFSLDTLALLERGQTAVAAAYVAGTVVACVGGCALGMLVGRVAIR
ncbi:MAG: fluoride efflux transporter CrcB [Pseudomonadota bacterium]